MARAPNYCATKAALHHFILTLRVQLEPFPVQVIELFPPAVQTELHDAKHQPTIENGGQIGIPIEEFMEQAWAGIVDGKDEIPVGFVVSLLEKIDGPRKTMMKNSPVPWNPAEFDKISS
jgi:short-subunit dehydrogenase involved in D-alanine esterification of teichoic acids